MPYNDDENDRRSKIIALNDEARYFARRKQFATAFECFEEALALDSRNCITLNSYARVLESAGKETEAVAKYQQSLQINSRDTYALTGSGKILAARGNYTEAFAQFEASLRVKAENTVTLTSYGTALAQAGRFEEAFAQFEASLRVKAFDTVTLNSYGTALAQAGRFEEAFAQFEASLRVKAENTVTLTSYGTALAQAGRVEEAFAQFEASLRVKKADLITLFLAAVFSHRAGKITAATQYMAQITGLLAAKGENSQKARRKAVASLKTIVNQNPSYLLLFNQFVVMLENKELWELFNTTGTANVKDTQELSSAIYHKVLNEVGLLRIATLDITAETAAGQELQASILAQLELLREKVVQKRELAEDSIQQIPTANYERLIKTIGTTAHDVVDKVSQGAATMKMVVNDALDEWPPASHDHQEFAQILERLGFMQAALNDLKDMKNEGIAFKERTFLIEDCFAKWAHTPTIGKATLQLDLQNAKACFYGDLEKISSMISELIENSLKHNADLNLLQIKLTSLDVVDPLLLQRTREPGKGGKYWQIIFQDDGRGLPQQRKERIFLPLETTALEKKGSGMGLFIIRRTLEKMGGRIAETGEKGARFELLLPYKDNAGLSVLGDDDAE